MIIPPLLEHLSSIVVLQISGSHYTFYAIIKENHISKSKGTYKKLCVGSFSSAMFVFQKITTGVRL